MYISIFDLFSIGIGPSSSHTVGPMRAAKKFIGDLLAQQPQSNLERIHIELFGSLALTCTGHGTDKAIINGLMGLEPHSADPDSLIPNLNAVKEEKKLTIAPDKTIVFDYDNDFTLRRGEFLEHHSNGMRFHAYDNNQNCILSATYYSTGGGFIVREEDYHQQATTINESSVPFPFDTASALMSFCQQEEISIAELVLLNEAVWRTPEEIDSKIEEITHIMSKCIERGCQQKGILPGGLNVVRRAPLIHDKLPNHKGPAFRHSEADMLNRLNLYAMAVNEENAAGGRVVTAPTNGAAGIIPAVLEYHKNFHAECTPQTVKNFFLTAGAIGILFKLKASISGAEVGCQGEVGVACSMAAAGLTAALGGNILQIENAAEIAMEHHLGMTCDPIAGLVQIPCIERNAMGAVKAVNAAHLALIGNGQHIVPLDKVIKTMMQTGRDMMSIYKETSLGGLAVNVTEC